LPALVNIEIGGMDYEKWLSECPLHYKKKLIADFIQETVVYAENHIEVRVNEIQNGKQPDREQKIKRISKWFSYIEFQKHTLKELQTEKIDRMIP